jgi:hypothetical protein
MKTFKINKGFIGDVVVLLSAICILCMTGPCTTSPVQGDATMNDIADFKSDNSKRESITFILGEDEKGSKPYYSLAYDYYQTDKNARTEYIDSTCRSLSEVRDYLENNPPGNGRPWGVINLISHGNEWFGMSVKVTPTSKRSTTERILEFVKNGGLKELPDSLADDSTQIILHGCGLGKDHELLKTVAKAFGGDGECPVVRASKLKEYYSSVQNSDKLLQSELFFAESWNVFYKYKDRPTDEELAADLKKTYPDANIDWIAALKTTFPSGPEDIFSYTINVPVIWYKKYYESDTLPDLSTDVKTLKWINKQKALLKLIGKANIPSDKFKWSTEKFYMTDDNGTKRPTISVSGMCTVLCVLRPMVKESPNSCTSAEPFLPLCSDTTYFWSE